MGAAGGSYMSAKREGSVPPLFGAKQCEVGRVGTLRSNVFEFQNRPLFGTQTRLSSKSGLLWNSNAFELQESICLTLR